MRSLALLATFVLVVAAAPSTARACGGGFSSTTAAAPTTIGTQRALLELGASEVTGTFEIRGEGPAEGFVWVLPLPGFTSVEEAPAELFASLDAATRPSVTIETFDGAGEESGGCGCFDSTAMSGDSKGLGAGASPVEVVASGTLGPLAYDVIAPGDPAAMEAWLTAEGYAVPESVKPLLQRYAAAGQYFLWAKGRPGAQLAELKPLRIRWPRAAGAPVVYGLELAQAGAADDVSVSLWIRAESGRVEAGGPWHVGTLSDVVETIRSTGGGDYEVAFAATLERLGPPAFLIEAGFLEADGRYLTRLRTSLPKDALLDVPLVETNDKSIYAHELYTTLATRTGGGSIFGTGLFFATALVGLGLRRRRP